jgi:uncharacterized membrane-anchored protein
LRELLLFIHILAAASWLGANVTQIVVNPVMAKTGGAAAAAWMRQTLRMGNFVYAPAAVVALITGIFLVIDGAQWEFEQFFVALGFITVIVGAVLGTRVFGPLGRKAAELYDSGDAAAAAAVQSKLGMWGYVDTALIVLTIYAMVSKLGAV